MSGQLAQFALSLAAVTLLVLVVHWAGFSKPARLAGEAEAREIAALTPGGFAPVRIALDSDGRGAIAEDAAGRVLLVRAHGGQFVPEIVSLAALRANGTMLLIDDGRRASLDLGAETANWPGA